MEKNLLVEDYAITKNWKSKLYNVENEKSYDCDYVICSRELKSAYKVYAYFYDLCDAEKHLDWIRKANP